MLRILLVFLLCTMVQLSNAQSPERLLFSNNISSRHITSIDRDADGYLWFGTEHGLNRYNGSSFHTYYSDGCEGSLHNDAITSVIADSAGFLWVGTQQGVEGFDMERQLFMPVGPRDFNPVAGMALLQNNGLVYSDLYGINYVDRQSMQVTGSLRDSRLANAKALLQLQNGTIAVAKGDGINQLVILTPKLSIVRQVRLSSQGEIRGLSQSPDGQLLLVATTQGLLAYNTQTWEPMPSDKGSMMDISRGHDVVCMSKGDDFFILVVRDVGLIASEWNCVGHLVLGTDIHLDDDVVMYWGNGFFVSTERQAENGFKSVNYYQSYYNIDHLTAEEDALRHIEAYKNSMVLLQGRSSLQLLDIQTGQRQVLQLADLDPVKVNFATFDAGRDLLLACQDGSLRQYAIVGNRAQPTQRIDVGGNIEHVSIDSHGSQWVASGANVYRISGGQKANAYRCASGRSVWQSVFDARTDKMYFFSVDGCLLTLPDCNADTLASFLPEISNPSCLYTDSQQQMWIGTMGNGIYRYDLKTQTLHHFTAAEHLADGNIMAVMEDDDSRLWICCRTGILQYDRQNELFIHPSDDQDEDRYVYQPQRSAKAMNGALCFGGLHSISVLRPDQVFLSEPNLQVDLDGLVVCNKPMSYLPGTSCTLDYDQNQVSIYFSVLDLFYGNRHEYSYRLNGYDPDWVFPGQSRSANYSNLPAGNYTFEVRVLNRSGQWSEPSAIATFSIRHAPWLQPWMIVLYVLIAVSLICFAIWLYIRWRVREKRLELAQKQREVESFLHRGKLEFFGNISHEFRTPLSLIFAPVKELLSSRYLTEHDRKMAELVSRQSNRLYQLTGQLLQFGKLNTSRHEHLKVASYDIGRQLSDIIESYSLRVTESGQTISYEGPRSQDVCCDRDMVEKMVCNLINNAIKYTPDKGHIELKAELKEGQLQLYVTDTGIGIPADMREHLFERYNRLGAEQSHPDTPGFGIGLNYVYHLVQLHHGTIAVSEGPSGQGSSFSICLPSEEASYFAEERESQNAQTFVGPSTSETVSSPAPQTPVSSKAMLLVVEDDPDVRSYLYQLLSPRYQVLLAADGEEGLDKVRQMMPDIVISDIVMPRRDGYELTRAIKEDADLWHIPIILLTAKDDAQSQLQGVETGAEFYISKPFDPDYLAVVIQNILINRSRLQQYARSLTSSQLASQPDQVPQDGATAPDATPADVQPQLTSRERQFLERIYALMDKNLSDENFSVESLAGELCISRSSLFSKIKTLTDLSPQQLMADYRMKRAMEMLKDPQQEHNVSEICYLVGFSSLSGFSRSFKKKYGISPRAVLNENE